MKKFIPSEIRYCVTEIHDGNILKAWGVKDDKACFLCREQVIPADGPGTGPHVGDRILESTPVALFKAYHEAEFFSHDFLEPGHGVGY